MSKYEATIGIEMHCELKSNRKVFSVSQNDFNDIPNSLVSKIDLALPGTLPVLNFKNVKDSLKMALLLNCEVAETLEFDRKNYYYPDLPKGYQITQMHNPIGINGYLDILDKGENKRILIHDVHLEEDSASLDHFNNFSLINYNRAGVPLLELVTEPSFTNADQVITFLETIRKIYQYADISDADTKKGQIRCDVNVSIREKGSKEYGTRVEVKNVNSFANIYETINYEIERQSNLLDNGKYDEVVQETRRWDEENHKTVRMRSKVDAIDYKYFAEPNIPLFKITEELVKDVKKSIPKMFWERKKEYLEDYKISAYDADIILKNRAHADYYEECVRLGIDPKVAANWFITNILAYLNNEDILINDFYITPKMLKEITDGIDSGKISSKQGKEIFNKVLIERKEPSTYMTKENSQISDRNELESIISSILSNNPNQVESYHNGKSNLFDFFVGGVMKETKGKANPVLVKEILREKLEK